ncbi:PAS domain S-box-containing protein [Cnuella takakiae]|uniref:histidine kinase n=1 Tax=Cnuella takakiae TaxID=1302690 RepID=A0A1M4VYF7_9BACT|nr:PAS domain S-box protein [Cnuella takakiae]OLY92462.1 hypothetical protein BUE76_11620 [Cnuella takakiae]SHE74084.1 PAS domain S-box-containing protein [Cnuella takakiae]
MLDPKIFEARPGISAVLLPDAPLFTVMAVSNDLVRSTGLPREALIGRGFFEQFPQSTLDPEFTGEQNIRASLEYIQQQKVPHGLPQQRYDVANEDGSFTEKYWQVYNVPVLGNAGELLYIIHTAEDITGQVQARKKAQKLEGIEKAFGLFMHAPMVVGMVNGDNYVLEMANEEALKLWGKGKEIIGKPILQSLPELKGQGIIELFNQVRTTGQPYIAHEVPVSSMAKEKEELHYFNLVYQPYFTNGSTKATGVFTISHDVTEQVKARQKVQEANKELQFVTDTLPQLVWAAEANGYTYFFNKGWLEFTGLPLEAVQGDGWMQSLHPDDLERTHAVWNQALQTGTIYEIEYRLKRFDGKYRWFLTRGTPMQDAHGRILKWYGSTTDVHEQIRAAEALQQSTERFYLVAKATQDVIWDWNLRTDEIWWNEGFKELFGYQAEEIEPTVDSWYNRVHTDDKERIVGGIHEVISSGGTNWSAEYRFRKKDGSYALVFDRGYIIHDKDGKASRMLGSMQDITERKKVEADLRLAHERIVNILESTADAFYALDEHFNFTYVNKKAAQLWGSDREALIGKHYWTEFPKAVGSQSYHMHYQAQKEGRPVHYETVSPLLGIWIDTSIYPGTDGGLSVFFRDITERKQWQEELEKKVEERTQALADANEALHKSNEELERSNKNLEQFAYAASHDLKEPMRKIQIFSDRLKGRLEGKLEEDDKHYFTRIINATHRMNTLIDDLLLYSHVSRGAVKDKMVDLNKKIQLVLEDLEVELAEKKATIKVAELPTIKGHRQQLQQLFLNLIGNALKYSNPDIPPVINITSKQVKGIDTPLHLNGKRGEMLYHLVVVQDNGIGFDQEDAERIFNVFTRLHGNAEYRGTGVGLSIAQNVVQNHGGYIWAESIPGRGATFSVLLPIE